LKKEGRPSFKRESNKWNYYELNFGYGNGPTSREPKFSTTTKVPTVNGIYPCVGNRFVKYVSHVHHVRVSWSLSDVIRDHRFSNTISSGAQLFISNLVNIALAS
jgi:hypothetical protein